MEIEPITKNLNGEEIVIKKLDEACDMDTDVVVEVSSLLMVSDLNDKSKDLPLDFASLQTKSLEIAWFDSRQDNYCLNSLSGDSPRTPKNAIFDPFTPGPDRLMLAPFCSKYKTNSTRSFSLSHKETEQCESDVETFSAEQKLLEDVYDDLLEAIILKQADEVSILNDECETPTSENLLDDVAETCPDAPMKATRKLKNASKGLSKKMLDFNYGICRKLEF